MNHVLEISYMWHSLSKKVKIQSLTMNYIFCFFFGYFFIPVMQAVYGSTFSFLLTALCWAVRTGPKYSRGWLIKSYKTLFCYGTDVFSTYLMAIYIPNTFIWNYLLDIINEMNLAMAVKWFSPYIVITF